MINNESIIYFGHLGLIMASKNVELVRDGMRLLLNDVIDLDDDVKSFLEHLLFTLEAEE